VDLNDDFFEGTLERQRGFRLTRFNRIVDRLGQLGYPLDDQIDKLLAGRGAAPGAALGRLQIARCLVAARYASSVDDAMQRLLGRGKPAYVPRQGLGRTRPSRPSGPPAACRHWLTSPTHTNVASWSRT